MEQDILLADLQQKFQELKKKLHIKASLDEIDKNFFVEDSILYRGYVSNDLSRQIRGTIIDIFYSWVNYLQGLLMPNPGSVASIMENKIFNKDEKNDISKIISRFLSLTSRNSVLILEKDDQAEGKFIDDSVKLWKSYFRRELLTVMKKINSEWEK